MAEDDNRYSASSAAQNLSHQISPEISSEISSGTVPTLKGNPAMDDPTHSSFMGGSRFATRHSLFMVLSLIALGSMAALFYHADQLLSKSLDQVRTTSYLSSLVGKIEAATLALNSESRNFILSKDLRYAENYKKRSDAIAGDLKLLIEDPAARDNQKLIATLNDGVSQHAGQFSTIVKIRTLLGLDAKAGIAGNANASLGALEKRLRQVSASLENNDIVQRLGTVIATELQIIQNPSVKKLQQIQIDIGLLNKAMITSPLPEAEKKTLLSLLQSHRSDITQLAHTRLTYTKEISRLGEINAYMAPSLASLINYTGNFSLLARQESKTTQDFIRKILSGGSAGILLALIFFAILLMRSISKPTRQLSEIALELANGNVSAPIPYLGNYDETGEIANSMRIFRENMLHADRLRKDLEVALNEQVERSPQTLSADTAPVLSEEEIALPGRGLIPNSHNLPSVTEQLSAEKETAIADVAPPPLPIGKGAITEISHQLTQTSQTASQAAEEAERTEKMVSGLDDAAEKIEDIEILMIGISDQMSLLAVQTALLDSEGSSEAENLIRLDDKRSDKKPSRKSAKAPTRSGVGQSVGDRIETIQGGTKRVIKAVQTIGTTINDVNEAAKEFSTHASKEALEAANELLVQSENLRTMLDNLLDKVDTNNSARG